jgi:hypothetical protein
VSKNGYGYTHGEMCACENECCTIMIFPAQVRTEKRNPVTREITHPLVTVDALMGALCGRMYGPVA